MATIYRKTTKGQQEVETRALKLAPKFRSLLIMVDGKRSDDELRRLLAQADDNGLEALAAGGFIEAIAVTADPRAPGRPMGEAPPPTGVPGAPPAGELDIPLPTAPVPPPIDLPRHRQQAARALTDLIGPLADVPAMRIENAKTLDELRAAIDSAIRIVASTRGRAAGADFAARFLPG